MQIRGSQGRSRAEMISASAARRIIAALVFS